jgi:hypothetical protein
VVLAATASLGAQAANADTSQSIDVSVSGSAGTNPYFNTTDGGWRAAATVSVDPRLSAGDEVTSVVLTGDFRLRQYTGQYGTDDSVAVGAAAQTRLSERSVLSGGLNLMSSRSGALDVLQIAPAQPPDQSSQLAPDVVPPDISAVGQGTRVTRYFAHAGFQDTLSETSQIDVGLSGGYTSSDRSAGQNYAQLDLTIDYDRTLNPRTSFLTTLTIGGSDYSAQVFRDARYVTPLVGIKSNLNENTSVTVQGGATLTHFVGGGDRVDAAANVNLCRDWLRSTLCAVLSRRSAPTAYEGVSTYDTAGLSYSLQTGENDRLALSANYGRTRSLEPGLAVARSTTVFGASADYSHELGKRTVAFIRPSVAFDRSSALANSSTRSSVQLELGIRQHFGDLR